jgi:hypothetical protein
VISAVNEVINQKTTNQYMIIEDRYLTLKRYLRLLIKENRLDIQNVECILKALDDEPIEVIGEKNED